MKNIAIFLLLFVSSLQAAVTQVNLKSFGARGDGVTDDYRAITNAIAQSLTNNSGVYVPFGTYYISQTITLPSRTHIWGDPVDITYKGAGPKMAVFSVSGNYSAFQTAPTTNTLNSGEWTSGIVIRDIYVKGPYLQATAPSDGVSWGLDVCGGYNIDISNFHVEGLGGGVRLRNVAEIFMDGCMYQNNYFGRWEQRDPATEDGKVYDSLVTTTCERNVNNVQAVVLSNVRFSYMNGGVIINNLTNLLSKVMVINTYDDQMIKLHGIEAAENQAAYPFLWISTNGAGSVLIEDCNLSTDQNAPAIVSEGYFDKLKLIGGSLERKVTNSRTPIIWAKHPPTTENGYLRANLIELNASTPTWFNAFVRNDQPSCRPENDYVPTGFIQINEFPNTGQVGNDGIISIAGDYSFSSSSMVDIAHVFWQNVATNNVFTFNADTNYTRGVDQIYVTAVVYDNGESDIPTLNVQGWGDQGIGWSRIGQAKVGEYTNETTGVVFSKWAWCVTLKDPSYAQQGLRWVQLFDIYGTTDSGTKANYGLERFCVYVPRQKNPYYPRILTHSAIPSTGLEGYHTPNSAQSFYWNDFSVTTYPIGWKNVAYGHPGTWVPLGDVYGGSYRNQYSIPTMVTSTDNGLIGTNAVYISSDGKRMSINSADTATYPLKISSDSGYSNSTLRVEQVVDPKITMSDTVDFSHTFGVDSAGNFFWMGSSTNDFRLQSGSGYFGGALVVAGALSAASVSASVLNIDTLNTLTLDTTNGVRFLSKTTGPTAAYIGAGNSMIWVSNAVTYCSSTTDGVALTVTKIAP